MKKACKVVTSYFGPRRKYPSNTSEAIDFWETSILPVQLSIDAGVECDTIIANHDHYPICEGDTRYLDFLNSIDGLKTKNGSIKVVNRPFENGLGAGFKSRDYVFKEYSTDYEYWFFSEDDEDSWHDGFLSKSIDYLKKNLDVAFVCCQFNQIARYSDRPPHCHGAIGCTTSKLLQKVIDKYGVLHYGDVDLTKSSIFDSASADRSFYRSFCDAEINFTYPFLEMGYSLGYLRECVYDFNNSNFNNNNLSISRVFRKWVRKINWPCAKRGPKIDNRDHNKSYSEQFPNDYDKYNLEKGFYKST